MANRCNTMPTAVPTKSKKEEHMMKKIIALMLVAILLSVTFALAASSQLSAASHGGYAQTGSIKKNNVGEPYVCINSMTNLDSGLYLYFRMRYSNGTAATPHYSFSGTGVRNVYYLDETIREDTDSSFFIRVQTQSDQTGTVTTNISWAP